MKRLNVNDYFSTSDLGLACAISLFYPIFVIDRSNPSGKVSFLFKRETGIEQTIEAYWKNELDVKALGFFQQIKVVKSRLYGKE